MSSMGTPNEMAPLQHGDSVMTVTPSGRGPPRLYDEELMGRIVLEYSSTSTAATYPRWVEQRQSKV